MTTPHDLAPVLDIEARKREARRLTGAFSKRIGAIAEAYRKRATKDAKRVRWGARSNKDTVTLMQAEVRHAVQEFYRIGGCIMHNDEPVLDVTDVEVGVEIKEDEIGAHLVVNIRPSADYVARMA